MRTVFILFLLLFTFQAHADEASKNQKLQELITVMDMDSMVDNVYSQMEMSMKNLSQQMGVKPSEQPIFDKYYTKMTAIMKKEMNWTIMEPLVLDIYRKNFNETEISEMLAFYKSPTGQAILKKMPLIVEESMQVSQLFAQKATPQLQALAQELGKELSEARHQAEHDHGHEHKH